MVVGGGIRSQMVWVGGCRKVAGGGVEVAGCWRETGEGDVQCQKYEEMRKIQETVHVTFDELSGGMTSELLGRTSSDLVKDPPTPSVSTTMQQFDELFQPWINEDEEFPPTPIAPVNAPAVQAPEIATATPSTTLISEGAPARKVIVKKLELILRNPLLLLLDLKLSDYLLRMQQARI
nr:hypothetical protein [Tanacetum cinerariifolium]